MNPKYEPHDPLQPDQGHADPQNIRHDDRSSGHHPNQEFIDVTESPVDDEASDKSETEDHTNVPPNQ